MNRLISRMEELRRSREKALALFLTAGYPTLESTVPLAQQCVEAGADILEIGMPFSDPIADGPVIQQSSATAIRNGVTLRSILAMVIRIRKASPIPLVLMGYMNPILRYGLQRFFVDAAAAGIDGVILPEIPLEESPGVRGHIERAGLSSINLVAPTTPVERIRHIDSITTGFLYCVSTTGVTGNTGAVAPDGYLALVKSADPANPVMVGFGVRGPDDAQRYARLVDGVIVGSAFVSRLGTEPVQETLRWVRSLKDALRG